MGTSSSSSSGGEEDAGTQELLQETGFSAGHLQRLRERFDYLDKAGRGQLRMEDFESIPDLDSNPIKDRIIAGFFSPGQETVDFPAFVRVLAHFRPRDRNRSRDRTQPEPPNTKTQKLRFAFQLYDLDGDGKISRAELLQVLQEMLGLQVNEEQLRCIAERAIQEADRDQDDAISFDEFKKSLEKVNVNEKMSIRFLE
ncbi:calcineurin B homologous protein 2 [Cololabis saira]|uniref:calcineurin B homologous protein 2 n=1 Tax=Cololabis saira TaxID=129043 RepID=UPI002AD57050|nr:calcineurin B homologous protein 2 [Cololabis saira]